MKKRPIFLLACILFTLSVALSPLAALADAPPMPVPSAPSLNLQNLFPTGARSHHYGIAAHPWWLKLQLDNFIKYYKDLHVGIVRLPVEWKTLEPSPGNYDFELNDRLLNRLNDEGFQIIAEFVTVPPWAASNYDECVKADLQCRFKTSQDVKDHLGAMAAALAKRYPFIRMWEFWNEPEQWPNIRDIAVYGPLLHTFYTATKQADPLVMVAASTLAGPPYIEWLYEYLDITYGLNSKAWDAVAYHPYTDQKQFEPDGSPSPLYKTRLEALRQLMIDHGDGNKPIWITEIGWDYQPKIQAAYLKSAFDWLDQRPYVTVVAVHLLNDWNEETYGLMTTVPNLYHTNLDFTANTTLVPKQPFYDAYKYYPKRKLPNLADAATDTKVFPDTLHSVQQPFLTAWQSGGLTLFGLPKTSQFYEKNQADGHYYLVQYFERVRMEYHPESQDVQFGLLGSQLLTERGWLDDNGLSQSGPTLPETRTFDIKAVYFQETSHSISGEFLAAWRAQGGLKIVGLPKTAVFNELNPDDGQTYPVQYFERARIELHPAANGQPAFVTFGLLGNDRLRLQKRLDKNNYPLVDDYYNPALPEFAG